MLYSANAKKFRELMQKSGYSRTLIKTHLWKYHYVFTHVLERTELRGNNVFVQVNVSHLDKKLGKMKLKKTSHRASKVVLDDLTTWDVLIREYTNTGSKEKNKYATRVRLKVHDSALVDGYEEWGAPADVVLCPEEKPVETKALTGIYKRLFDNLSVLDFDAVGARNYAKNALNMMLSLRDKRVKNVLHKNRYVNRRVYAAWVDKINKLKKRIWRESSDEHKTKRFFCILHSTPRSIRDFIFIKGQAGVEVDISASQCLMLAILLKRHYEDKLPDDVAHYIGLCETGQFYAYVQGVVGAQAMPRETFKQEFFARIFYSSENVTYRWRTLFADKENGFPNVSAFITQQKAGDYKAFPVALSALESEIMLERIAARLLDEGVTEFYTVHDAFYCTKGVRPRVKQVLAEVFAEYGVKAHVKESDPDTIEDPMDAKLAELEAQFAVIETEQAKNADYGTLNAGLDTMTDEERMEWTLHRLEATIAIDLEWCTLESPDFQKRIRALININSACLNL